MPGCRISSSPSAVPPPLPGRNCLEDGNHGLREAAPHFTRGYIPSPRRGEEAAMRLSQKQFLRLVEEAVAEIPPQMAVYLENVAIDVEDVPDAETCRSMELDDPTELMGLYHGTPLTERSVEMSGTMPDRIVIYQRNIEREARTRREIIDEVRTTVLHEIGHHFGLDEDALDDLGYG